MKLRDFVIAGILVAGLGLLVSCGSAPHPPESLPGDTMQIDPGPGNGYGYLQEVRLPSGTRCVVFSFPQGGGLDCEFSHDTNSTPQTGSPVER